MPEVRSSRKEMMEKIVTKRSLGKFRERDSPWKESSHSERLEAMTEICHPQNDERATEQGFPRVYRITRGKVR